MVDAPDTPSSEVEQLREQLAGLCATDPRPQLDAAKRYIGDTVASAAADARETVAKPIRQGVARVRGTMASARRTAAQVEAQRERLSQRTRSKPVATVAVAALAGYLLGRIVR